MCVSDKSNRKSKVNGNESTYNDWLPRSFEVLQGFNELVSYVVNLLPSAAVHEDNKDKHVLDHTDAWFLFYIWFPAFLAAVLSVHSVVEATILWLFVSMRKEEVMMSQTDRKKKKNKFVIKERGILSDSQTWLEGIYSSVYIHCIFVFWVLNKWAIKIPPL